MKRTHRFKVGYAWFKSSCLSASEFDYEHRDLKASRVSNRIGVP